MKLLHRHHQLGPFSSNPQVRVRVRARVRARARARARVRG